MSDNTYNGWTNWETWIVNVWVDNDQMLYEYVKDMAMEEMEEEVLEDKESAAYNLSKTMREQFDEWAPEISNGPYLDLLNGALREVDWLELARHLIERAQEDKAYAQQAN